MVQGPSVTICRPETVMVQTVMSNRDETDNFAAAGMYPGTGHQSIAIVALALVTYITPL
jgi:hypothetical protein